MHDKDTKKLGPRQIMVATRRIHGLAYAVRLDGAKVQERPSQSGDHDTVDHHRLRALQVTGLVNDDRSRHYRCPTVTDGYLNRHQGEPIKAVETARGPV